MEDQILMPCIARRGEAGLRPRASLSFVRIDSYNSKRNAEARASKNHDANGKGEGIKDE